MSCWLRPPLLSRPTTPELVVDPWDQYSHPLLNASCSAGWSPVDKSVMNGVTSPLSGSTVTMRELLFCPPPVGGLVGVRGEEPTALHAVLKGDVDGRAFGLKACVTRIEGRRLAKGPSDLVAVLIEHQNIGRHGVGRREDTAERGMRLLVARTRQAVPRLEHVDLELLRV